MQLRGRHLLLFDLVATALSFVLSFALRFDAPSSQFELYLTAYAWVIPLLAAIRVGAFIQLRLYQRVWRYASVEELVAVVVGVVVSSALAYGLVFVLFALGLAVGAQTLGFPRSVPVIDTLIMTTFAGAWRFSLRMLQVPRRGARARVGERALVVGGGSAALSVIRELREADLGFEPVGLLADDIPTNQRLMGLRVLGAIGDIAGAIQRERAQVVILALPTADGRTLRRLVHEAESAGARSMTVPSMAEVAAGRVTVDKLREIDVEDLLRRAPARIDFESAAASFEGRRILITGAGGSIGSELARQLCRFKPSSVVLLGRGENSIFEAMQSMPKSEVSLEPVILDVRDGQRFDALIRDVRPDVVFHAAAHKHVTFMERYPEEAAATNILGTGRVLDACVRHAVKRFVLISTDKAVNPSSVMGATKRVAELLVRDAALRANAPYVSVRFGNVLSSRGSVVPVFREQLKSGGPLTVTHPDVTRYFMTIPEAVQLVLQAAVLAVAGDTFVLDMGEPVRIVDLASDLVGLHGMELGKDVQLEFIGLRPGEKLHEELFFANEEDAPTTHEGIRRVVQPASAPVNLKAATADLEDLVNRRGRVEIVRWLQMVVPEYVPASNARAAERVGSD